MARAFAVFYGVVCYLTFLVVFLAAIWFVWTMDAPQPAGPLGRALLINTALLGMFAVQHSVMARQWFKRAWTKAVPPPIERSTYVLVASLVLADLIYFWQPMTAVVWEVENEMAVMILQLLFCLGWLTVLVSTFLIDHFDLFGLKQVWTYWRNKTYDGPVFKMPGPYKFVRHPLYFGFVVAFWSAPRMTQGHLFFAAMCTAYMLVAIQFEERDLIREHGEDYKIYRSGVSMLVPWPKTRKSQ
jgi:protein-S-isoprenylcysteine O-methyltransferase Ste14